MFRIYNKHYLHSSICKLFTYNCYLYIFKYFIIYLYYILLLFYCYIHDDFLVLRDIFNCIVLIFYEKEHE